MHVVALCSQKGGSGKTTLSGHLAVQAELAGYGPVALIDTDPQGSLAAWWNARSSAAPAFASTTLAQLPGDLERLRLEGCRLVVIDTPPAINMAIQRVINVADLVVIPTRPSPHDLRAVAGTVDMVERAQSTMVFVVNAANLRAKITAGRGDRAVAARHRGAGLRPATGRLRDLDDRRPHGLEIAPEGRSAQEIRQLWEYLAGQLEKRERHAGFPATDAARLRPPDGLEGVEA